MGELRVGAPADAYLAVCEPVLGRALSFLDAEATSPSQGSFDRTWWCWKFSDFSAPRFQEGVYTLAWLYGSANAPDGARRNERLLRQAASAIGFWSALQHSDGSFDEAYPFERSLAATAFTTFYVAAGIERIRGALDAVALENGLQSIERAALWLTRNDEFHGVLSNHLAAAAAALQVAGDVLQTDRFAAARDRFLGRIYDNQDREEGWFREYGGADPGYQSHGMFYLAAIWRRTRNAELLQRLREGCEFLAWFAHPDGTMGGEYASRGTKFVFPAAFEILSAESEAASAIAAHLRQCISQGRGVGAAQMDAWNMFPMLNNYLFAAEAATDIQPRQLPWQAADASRVFKRAGLALIRKADRIAAIGLATGGVVKMWDAQSNALIYEDAGYAVQEKHKWFSSQGASEWQGGEDAASFVIRVRFEGLPNARFDPWRFLLFRVFTLTIGRWPPIARGLKQLLVSVLIRRRVRHPASLERAVRIGDDGTLAVSDRLQNLAATPIPIARHVPFHMGSSRYADMHDWFGPQVECPPPSVQLPNGARTVTIETSGARSTV
ncbi:hypothetical protein [Bradyrhizobium sp.]|uniref:hypothetical protein n=1 Tax=Bradyrhizobium sp. TaxID=376 RepID=UPI001D9C2D0A|nr:hypothetical protein [Bradyrhizobium sp.]MBI5320788.1 hypothetical protein [Bradyrhizobium sp.]